MHTDAQECTKMRMGKNNTTFGKKQHHTRCGRWWDARGARARPGSCASKRRSVRIERLCCAFPVDHVEETMLIDEERVDLPGITLKRGAPAA